MRVCACAAACNASAAPPQHYCHSLLKHWLEHKECVSAAYHPTDGATCSPVYHKSGACAGRGRQHNVAVGICINCCADANGCSVADSKLMRCLQLLKFGAEIDIFAPSIS